MGLAIGVIATREIMTGIGSVGDGRRGGVGTGLSCVVEGESVPNRVEIDKRSGPGGLQSCFGAADVAALASAVAVGEQSEQPFDPWPAAPEMLSGRCSSLVPVRCCNNITFAN